MARASAVAFDEAAVKTAFLFNFFKFIEWPENVAQQEHLVLCTTSTDQLGNSLLSLSNKSIKNKPLLVKRNVGRKELKQCQMVLIDTADNPVSIVRDLGGLPIVTVSDEPDFVDYGGTIGLIQDRGRLMFEINQETAIASGLRISSELLKLAQRVIANK